VIVSKNLMVLLLTAYLLVLGGVLRKVLPRACRDYMFGCVNLAGGYQVEYLTASFWHHYYQITLWRMP
jgi:hypothetical protein